LAYKSGAVAPAVVAGTEELARRLFDAGYFRHQTGAAADDNTEQLWAKYKKVAWEPHIFGNRLFDTRYYQLFVSKQELSYYLTPLHHYVAVGASAGVSPSWIYDDTFYLETYPDVREAVESDAFCCGFEHFLWHGVEDGRDGCAFFNERTYLMRNADVAKDVTTGGSRSGEAHYVEFGHRERRPLS
jgi:hypothetical protein